MNTLKIRKYEDIVTIKFWSANYEWREEKDSNNLYGPELVAFFQSFIFVNKNAAKNPRTVITPI